jgi:hypothetical protein
MQPVVLKSVLQVSIIKWRILMARKTPEFPLRRSQLLTPFGIGAMSDFVGPQSMIAAGLDAWDQKFKDNQEGYQQFRIDDEMRLARRFGVSHFRLPPDWRSRPAHGAGEAEVYEACIPFHRFPLWHFCPVCGLMQYAGFNSSEAPICEGITLSNVRLRKHKTIATQSVRFVAACKIGHLTDFPWLEWAYGSSEGHPNHIPDEVKNAIYLPHNPVPRYVLRYNFSDSAGLDGIFVSVIETNGAGAELKKKSLGGAFSQEDRNTSPNAENMESESEGGQRNAENALSRIGVRCCGENPVLAIGSRLESSADRRPPGCGQLLEPSLKNAIKLYNASTSSALFIPTPDVNVNESERTVWVRKVLENQALKEKITARVVDTEAKFSLNWLQGSDLNIKHEIGLPDHIMTQEFCDELKVLALAVKVEKELSTGDKLDNWRAATKEIFDEISDEAKNELRNKIGELLGIDVDEWSVTFDGVLESLKLLFRSESDRSAATEAGSIDAVNDLEKERLFRHKEFITLSLACDGGQLDSTELRVRGLSAEHYGALVKDSFKAVGLLDKLRETRAFLGFTRLNNSVLSADKKWSLIARKKMGWLPAIIVRGEGVFLEFQREKMQEWIKHSGELHTSRIALPMQGFNMRREERGLAPLPAEPEYWLLHTFAHLLINQLVYECGYGSASLRERIYCHTANNDPTHEDSMYAVLIYTAAGDSEGTMGGLVRMGEPSRLEQVMLRALVNAKWCSSDPVCIESHGQGPNNCNLAACHSCGLLLETSCENFNALLDRGVVVGTLEKPDAGYFSAYV